MKKNRIIDIDFYEFAFLVEACVPPRPIAREHFWDKVINQYYNILTPEERSHLHVWINRNLHFQDSIEKGNEDCLLFNARFDPENQYTAKTNFKGEEKDIKCFKFKDHYYTGTRTPIQEQFIISVTKDEPERA